MFRESYRDYSGAVKFRRSGNHEDSLSRMIGALTLRPYLKLVMAFEEESVFRIPSEDLEQIHQTVGAVIDIMKSKGVEA